jgi:hypothetical protein
MNKIVILFCFLCASCSQEPYKIGYDDTLYEFAEKAAQGDLKAAYDGGMHCDAILKLDPSTLPALFLGKCGGFDALTIENAIMGGNPEEIDVAIGTYDFLVPHVSDPTEDTVGELRKYPKRKEFYMDIAQYRIQKRCAEPKPPASCQDKELLKKFGLECTFYNELKPITVPAKDLAKVK